MPTSGFYKPMNKPNRKFITPPTITQNYSNIARITQSATEIVLDFAYALPNEPAVIATQRVIMAPLSAQRLLRALQEQISKYEEIYGEIKIPNTTLADKLFKNVTSPADEKGPDTVPGDNPDGDA